MHNNNKKGHKKPTAIDNNPIEAITSIGHGVVDSFAKDLGQEAVNTLWGQLLGTKEETSHHIPKSGDLTEGQELNLTKKSEQSEAAIDYRGEILHGETRIKQKENAETVQQIEQILVELKALSEQTQELKIEFTQIAVERVPQNAGVYHKNLFEWMLLMVRDARQKVEASRNWLSASSKKANKKGYWNLFKSHGTSFGLSSERVVATQTG